MVDGERRGEEHIDCLHIKRKALDAGHLGLELAEAASDSGDIGSDAVEVHDPDGGGDKDDGDQGAGKPFGNLRGKDDDEQRHQSYGEGQPVGLSEAGEVDAPFRDEFRGKILEAETEEVVDLSGEYRKGDTGGKAYHNRVRDELDDRSELEEPHKDKYHASHKGSHGQTFHTETGDDAVDNHDECPRRASDLHGVSSESRHHETAQDGGHQSYGGTQISLKITYLRIFLRNFPAGSFRNL